MNKVRKRRSGISSLKESLPMHVPLTDSHDSPMTVRAAVSCLEHDLYGKPVPTFPDHARASMRISCTSPCSPNNSAMRQTGDMGLAARRMRGSVAHQDR